MQVVKPDQIGLPGFRPGEKALCGMPGAETVGIQQHGFDRMQTHVQRGADAPGKGYRLGIQLVIATIGEDHFVTFVGIFLGNLNADAPGAASVASGVDQQNSHGSNTFSTMLR